MRYMLLIYDDESIFPKMSRQETEKLMGEYGRFTADLKAAGAHLESARLRPVATATAVRVRNDRMLATDGPFAETKEQLGGFYMIDARNLDEAIKWASKIPSARLGCVEVRPVWEMSE